MAPDVEFPFFLCEECGCEAFVIVGPLDVHAPVRCGACMTHIGTWAEFRMEIEASIRRLRRERRLRPSLGPTVVKFDAPGNR